MTSCQSRPWNCTRTLYNPTRRGVTSYTIGSTYRHLRGFSSCIPRFTKYAQQVAGEESANDGRFVLPAVSRFHDTQDIHVNDLGATLRAHRATNRAKILRRVGAHSDPTVKHILERELNDYTDHGQTSPTENTLQAAKERKQEKPVAEKLAFRVKGNRRKPWEFWPAGSIQHQQLVSSKQKEPTGSVLEYHARSINPAGVWKRPSEKACNNPYLFRPWHRYLEEQGGDALQRWVSMINMKDIV